MVRTKRGNLSPFSRDKLFMTVYQSCGHRKTALADADGLTATVIGKLMSQSEAVIDSHTIQTVTHAVLKNFDAAAAVSYAAYHRS